MLAGRNQVQGPSDEQLMLLSSKGERWAFELLYERYFDKLVWFARGFVQDEQQAEDVVQEIFIRVIEKPELFDARKKFSTWVYTITGNACKNVLRNEQNRNRIIQEQVAPHQQESMVMRDEAEHSILKERIQQACKELNEKEKNIFALRFEQELSIKEIAEITQAPEGSVKSSIYYLLRKIGPFLKDYQHEK